MARPTMRDNSTLIAAGINPKTGLPLKFGDQKSELKTNIKKLLRIVDEQDAVNRYVWYNLPEGLNGQLLERVLYYKGQGAFIYIEEMKKFYFLPYALDGAIDLYGRYTGIRPLPFNGSTQDTPKGQEKLKLWLNTQIKKPVYDIILPEDLTLEDFHNSAVLLKDYTEQVSQSNLPRQTLQDPLLDIMADCIPFMRTSLLNATGVSGMRVGTQDEQSNVVAAANAVERAALEGDKWVPIVGAVDFQDFNSGQASDPEKFLLALQSLDNFRLEMYGIENGGVFQKRQHMLQEEQDMSANAVGLVLQDGLINRQRFCNIVNSIWGLGIWCDVSEKVSGVDRNMDGQLQDDMDQSGTATEAPETVGGNE